MGRSSVSEERVTPPGYSHTPILSLVTSNASLTLLKCCYNGSMSINAERLGALKVVRCHSKYCYPDEETASNALKAIRSVRGASEGDEWPDDQRIERRAYYCEECGFWHLTSMGEVPRPIVAARHLKEVEESHPTPNLPEDLRKKAETPLQIPTVGVFSAGTLPHMKVDNAVIVAVPDDYVEVELDDNQFALLYASGILKEVK